MPRKAIGPRRRWVIVTLAALLILAGGLGCYWAFYRAASTPSSNPGSVGNPPSGVNLTGTNLAGEDVNVSLVGSGVVANLTPGASFNLSADLFPSCSPYGCSPEVRSIFVNAPFTLLATSPTLPYNWSSSASVLLTLHLRAPASPGNYVLNGTVQGLPLPGPVTVTALAFQTNYSGADSGYLTVAGPALPLKVKPNATFSLTLELTSSSWYTEAVAGLALSSPFRLASVSETFPQTIAANGTLSVPCSVIAPASGNYTLGGAVAMAPTPVVTVANVSWAMTYYTNPYYSIAPVVGAPPTVVHLGQKFTLDLVIYDNDTTSHVYDVTGINTGWTLLASSPNGNTTVPAGGQTEWVLTIQAPSTTGYYNLVVHIANWT